MKETNQKKGIEKQKNNKKEERISYKKWAGGGRRKKERKRSLYIYIYIYPDLILSCYSHLLTSLLLKLPC
jgi:hypothetical protein